MAAVIPPHSDNESARELRVQPPRRDRPGGCRCGHRRASRSSYSISTVAVYGSRTLAHRGEGRATPSSPPFSTATPCTKALAERYIMERGLQNWVILRQTAILYDKIVFNNIRDGLLFHTTLNGPLEWITARDSGYLIRRIAERKRKAKTQGFGTGCLT